MARPVLEIQACLQDEQASSEGAFRAATFERRSSGYDCFRPLRVKCRQCGNGPQNGDGHGRTPPPLLPLCLVTVPEPRAVPPLSSPDEDFHAGRRFSIPDSNDPIDILRWVQTSRHRVYRDRYTSCLPPHDLTGSRHKRAGNGLHEVNHFARRPLLCLRGGYIECTS